MSRLSHCKPPAIWVHPIDCTYNSLNSALPLARLPAGLLSRRARPRQKIAFLQSLDVFSVPTVYRESKGLPALEAMANAVPVVLPDHGSFAELIADTNGGLLCRPHDAADLADKLAELLRDPQRAMQLGLDGQQAIQDRYHAGAMARQTLELYQSLAAL